LGGFGGLDRKTANGKCEKQVPTSGCRSNAGVLRSLRSLQDDGEKRTREGRRSVRSFGCAEDDRTTRTANATATALKVV
jgi:hypothetical protein